MVVGRRQGPGLPPGDSRSIHLHASAAAAAFQELGVFPRQLEGGEGTPRARSPVFRVGLLLGHAPVGRAPPSALGWQVGVAALAHALEAADAAGERLLQGPELALHVIQLRLIPSRAHGRQGVDGASSRRSVLRRAGQLDQLAREIAHLRGAWRAVGVHRVLHHRRRGTQLPGREALGEPPKLHLRHAERLHEARAPHPELAVLALRLLVHRPHRRCLLGGEAGRRRSPRLVLQLPAARPASVVLPLGAQRLDVRRDLAVQGRGLALHGVLVAWARLQIAPVSRWWASAPHHATQLRLQLVVASDLLAQAVVQGRDVLPQVDDILDGRVVVPAQAQDRIHEVLEGQDLLGRVVLVVLCEDDVDVLDETGDVDTDLLQRVARLRPVDDVGELLLGDRRVSVLVDLFHDLHQLLLDV
mmetsp:Transcript_59994/g.176032  ORF Transcript_59994/g.176032 Transcript_59994/m.176032 type:complete len:415 (+) Transcript_59994:186-1430(+)